MRQEIHVLPLSSRTGDGPSWLTSFLCSAFIHAFRPAVSSYQVSSHRSSISRSAACRVPTCRYDNSPLTTGTHGTPVRRIGTRGPPCRPCLAALASALALRLLFHSADALGPRPSCRRALSLSLLSLGLSACSASRSRRSPLAAAAPPLLAWLLPVATSTKYGWATREQ